MKSKKKGMKVGGRKELELQIRDLEKQIEPITLCHSCINCGGGVVSICRATNFTHNGGHWC